MRPRQIPADVQQLRNQAGLCLAETATRTGYSERQVRRFEGGQTPAPLLYLQFLQELAARKVEKISSGPAAFRFIDLFAGIGGLRLGFESIGGKCVFTSEWDKYSNETYRRNFPADDHAIVGDIRPFGENPSSIPAHDVLLAGFPCQPFSIAGVSKKNSLGRPHGFDCETQGTLFFEIERILAHHRPAAFLLENVKNLERHDKGVTFRVIMDVLQHKLKYKLVRHKVISSHPWVPQKRERIFIAGFREDSDFSFDTFDEKRLPDKSTWPKLGSILNGHNQVEEKYTLTAHLWQYLQDYKRKHECMGNGFGCSVFGPEDVTRTLSARYYKDGSEILVRQRGKRPRRLMPAECARLMGFIHHDGSPWEITVSDTQAYKQFGNAVVVPVVKAVAKHMEAHILAAVELDRKKVTPFPAVRKKSKRTAIPKTRKIAHA